MRQDSKKQLLVYAVIGLIPVVWAALLVAPAISGGLPEILAGLTTALNNPLRIVWCEDSLKTVLFFIVVYAFGIGIYLSTRKNKRPREEHGSAQWGDAATVNRKYRDKRFNENKILTQNVRIGLDGKRHRRNLNVLICGGSGSGKTRFYAKPNVIQCDNSSKVILDPKGEIARDTGMLLAAQGVDVKVLDLINLHPNSDFSKYTI